MRISNLSLIGATVFGSFLARPLVATALLPAGGLSATSYVVGGLGVLGGATGIHGGGTANRLFVGLGGLLLGGVDPDPGILLNGQVVIHYPSDLLAVRSVGWFGPFALDPTLPVPPVVSTSFWETGDAVYNVVQPPNPAMTVSTSDSEGVLTISFDASPMGIASASDQHFNLLAVGFQNISGVDLDVTPAAQDVANFFSSSGSSFTCIPNPSVSQVAVSCGANMPPSGYTVTGIPEPRTFALMGLGLLGLAGHGLRRRYKKGRTAP